MLNLLEVTRTLRTLGVDYSKPGFYEDLAFMAQKKNGNPRFLELYADYISIKKYSKEYLETTRNKILELVTYIADQLQADPRKGMCVPVCLILSKMLEQEGIWNYVVNGSLTVDFKPITGVSGKANIHAFKSSDHPFKYGHFWICAPPFKIIDLTVSKQDYGWDCRQYFPPYILQESVRTTHDVEVSDLIEEKAEQLFQAETNMRMTLADLDSMSLGLLERLKKYGVFEIETPALKLKYAACALSALPYPLSQVYNFYINGRRSDEIYQSFLLHRQQVKQLGNGGFMVGAL